MDLSWPVNHMGEMGRVTTRHPPDRNKELMVMRVVGDTCQGHPGGFFLIAESATDDVKLRFVAFVRLAKASKKIDPIGLGDMAIHGVSPPFA
jgi:hypothetical protein